MFQEINFQTQKKEKKERRKKKKKTLKKFLIFWKMQFSCYKLKELLILQEGTEKAQKTNLKSASTKFLVSLQQ